MVSGSEWVSIWAEEAWLASGCATAAPWGLSPWLACAHLAVPLKVMKASRQE